MKKVDRSEILPLGDYEAIRERFRNRIIAMKQNRRVSVGPHMTFIFENHDTMLFQIQEMLRTERITAEKAIAHEIDTYNDLVPGADELSSTLMIEHTDKEERAKALTDLSDLDAHVFMHLGDTTAKATFTKLPGEEEGRLPAVNYVRFPMPPGAADELRDRNVEVRLEVTHPTYAHTATLTAEQRAELADDLDG